jgi:hypothetical protein
MAANWWMLANSDGKKDGVLTMAVWCIVVILAKLLLAGITFKFNGKDVNLGGVDAGVIAALLTPTLGAYVARRMTDTKAQTEAFKIANTTTITTDPQPTGRPSV